MKDISSVVNILLCLRKESERNSFGNSEKTVNNEIENIDSDEIEIEIVI
ncbi:MAG: hypothetical protein QN829_02140 [Nitrososphaeraceae archaeon]|nr:hypothetical protein [Nitrososphaeraceae archaeon]